LILERNTLSDVIYYFKGERSSVQLDQADRHLPFDGHKQGTLVRRRRMIVQGVIRSRIGVAAVVVQQLPDTIGAAVAAATSQPN
jgi:hypothetical protein